jgi:lipase chaperone LimK
MTDARRCVNDLGEPIHKPATMCTDCVTQTVRERDAANLAGYDEGFKAAEKIIARELTQHAEELARVEERRSHFEDLAIERTRLLADAEHSEARLRAALDRIENHAFYTKNEWLRLLVREALRGGE